MQYSKQLIEDLSNHLNPKLVAFFEIKNNILEFPVHSIPALVEFALNKHFKGASNQEDLIPIINNVKQARLRKRIRWFNSLQNDISILSYDDPKFPFANIIDHIKSLSVDTYTQFYGNKTISYIINEEMEKVISWRNNSNFL